MIQSMYLSFTKHTLNIIFFRAKSKQIYFGWNCCAYQFLVLKLSEAEIQCNFPVTSKNLI